MDSSKKLLLGNKAWVRERLELRPDYFEKLSREQRPEFLWIGCSDSRVPAEEITGAQPGEIFVHRNIANLVVHTDANLFSVVQYAVETLEVKHVIVCGHYGCGGVRAALSGHSFGLLNKWLHVIKDVYSLHKDEMESLTEEAKLDRMVEFNVKAQVNNLAHTSLMQKAWRNHGGPTVHGWIFGLEDGLLSELVRMEPGSPIDKIYQFDFD